MSFGTFLDGNDTAGKPGVMLSRKWRVLCYQASQLQRAHPRSAARNDSVCLESDLATFEMEFLQVINLFRLIYNMSVDIL